MKPECERALPVLPDNTNRRSMCDVELVGCLMLPARHLWIMPQNCNLGIKISSLQSEVCCSWLRLLLLQIPIAKGCRAFRNRAVYEHSRNVIGSKGLIKCFMTMTPLKVCFKRFLDICAQLLIFFIFSLKRYMFT